MTAPLANLHIIAARPRFPENIGMMARACANMGCPNLVLIKPEIWNYESALKLATDQGKEILDNMAVEESLGSALENMHLVCATTARLGGCRKEIVTPEEAAEQIVSVISSGMNAAIVLGSENSGLNNQEIAQADIIAHIPTASGSSSLNLAQAALLMLYACFKLIQTDHILRKQERLICHSERTLLETEFKKRLLALDCLPEDNPDYFFRVWKTILSKANLRRNEFNVIMGLFRQIDVALRKK